MKINLWVIAFVLLTQNTLALTSGECGTGCSYTLDDDGLLTVTGSGENASIRGGAFSENGTIKNVVIQGSIKSIESNAFIRSSNIKTIDMDNAQVKNISAWAFEATGIEKMIIPSSVRNIDCNAFQRTTALKEIIINSENVDFLTFTTQRGNTHSAANYGTVICKDCTTEQAQSLKSKLDNVEARPGIVNIHENDANGNTLIKDVQGNYIGGFDLNGNKLDVDTNGRITALYDSNNLLVQSYSYGSDGSIATYDKNGKLIGLRGKRIYTIEEATALAQKNKNTFTLKYR